MSLHSPKEIAAVAIQSGIAKHKASVSYLLILGFMAGAFIATGFLLDLHVINQLPADWGSFASLLGASVFPLGIILTVLAGAELLTGNMMTLPIAWFARQISGFSVLRNWFWVTIANFLGSIAVAWFFGHVLGMTEGDYLKKRWQRPLLKCMPIFCMLLFLLSAVTGWSASPYGCRLPVKDVVGKIFGMWFPVMAFVALGFQHVVANMFIIPAAIFAGSLSWGDYLTNFVAVFFGNAVGGAIFVGLAWFMAFRPQLTAPTEIR
ncbi:formate/nitrite transporter family protein [Erwinia sp. OLCASP19]|uniref:formate/nitrite transporter family protein n=1 Tax=unclassified Erwinia TaxID=2622719 RepID=UPI002695DAA2